MKTKSGITIRIATADDLEAVTIFLRQYFTKDEPMCRHLGLTTNENPINKNLENYCLYAFGKGVDLVAEHNGKLVGLCLNILVGKDTRKEDFPHTKDSNFEKMKRMIEYVHKQIDYIGRYPDIDQVMYLSVLSVHNDYRRKGIAKKLIEKTRDLAIEQRAGLVTLECTSCYSAAAVKSLGFEEIYSINYADYKENNEVVIDPPHPHKTLSIHALRI